MDQHTAAGEALPMDKQEVVKEDGRALIYYTFPDEGEATRTPQGEGPEADRV